VKQLTHRLAVLALGAAAGAACRSAGTAGGPRIVQPGAPGQSSRTLTAAAAADLPAIQYTAADVQFIQGMIGHHGQAVEMTALLATHTASADMRKLGQRIAISQQDEIVMMQRWLEVRGEERPGPHATHALMPGMLTPEEMDRLANARGGEFDRLFLAGMIKHHAGALRMVEELFSHEGAGQEPDIFAFASEVDADQRMEIDRMTAMLQELQENESR
jgi:uncharacterized protein (DUF305 family)